jgi:hypothetical protein
LRELGQRRKRLLIALRLATIRGLHDASLRKRST